MLVKDNQGYKRRDDLSFIISCAECLFVQLTQKSEENLHCVNRYVLIGVIYRPPNTSIDGFNERIGDFILFGYTRE